MMEFTLGEIKVFLIVLKKVKEKQISNEGLCANIRENCKKVFASHYSNHIHEYRVLRILSEFYMDKAVQGWEFYSGYWTWPINHPIHSSPEKAYSDSRLFSTMYEGEYGRRRLELLDRMINLVQEDLKKIEADNESK